MTSCKEDVISSKHHGFGIRHVQIACMWLTMMVLFIGRSSLGVAILAMTDVERRNDTNIDIYEWDKKTQGLILSSFFWGYTTMQIPAGLLAKRFGGKPILLVSLLANGFICLFLPTLAKVGWWMVCICRVAMGLTQACLFPASHTLLGRWLPANERTTLTGVVYGGSHIGTIIAMPVSGFLAETTIGWKLIFYSISGLMFATAAVWYWFSASSPDDHSMMTDQEKYYIEMGLQSHGSQVDRPTPWRDILSTVPLWAIAMTHISCGMGYVLFFVDMPTYLERALRISLRNSALLSALPYIGMWIGTVGSAVICEKIYNRGLLSIGTCRKIFNSLGMFGIGFALLALSFLGPENKTLAVITLIAGLTLSGCTSAGFIVNHLDLSPHFAGVMFSLTNCINSMCSMLMPVGTSFILRNDSSDVSRWHIVFLITAAISIGGNIFYIIFSSSERQPWDNPDYQAIKKADPEEMRSVLTKQQDKEVEANKQQDTET